MRYQLKIFTLFFNKIYLFSSFLQFIWENVQDLKSHNPFIYKDFAKGFTKSVSSNLYWYLLVFFHYSFLSLPYSIVPTTNFLFFLSVSCFFFLSSSFKLFFYGLHFFRHNTTNIDNCFSYLFTYFIMYVLEIIFALNIIS